MKENRNFKIRTISNRTASLKASLAFCISLALLISACKPGRTTTGHVTADEDFRSLFYSDSGGITGADGLFSVLMPDGSSLFMLGDCFLGKVVNGTRDTMTTMLRNAFVLIDNGRAGAKPIYRGTWESPQTLMEPVNEPGDSTYRWYWPGHGFVKNDTLHVFALSLITVPDTAAISSFANTEGDQPSDTTVKNIFTFAISHIDLLSFSLPGFGHLGTHRVEINYPASQIDFGNCVMADEGYLYIYGTRNKPGHSQVHVARVPIESACFYKGWEYFTGNDWDKDISRSAPLDIDLSVSEQFSVFRYRDKYILLTQERAGDNIYTYISDFPYRDFHSKKFIYHTPEAGADPDNYIITYNALAHGQYIENDRLLVTYCVNSLNVRDIFEDVEAYRARFLRVPMDLIFK